MISIGFTVLGAGFEDGDGEALKAAPLYGGDCGGVVMTGCEGDTEALSADEAANTGAGGACIDVVVGESSVGQSVGCPEVRIRPSPVLAYARDEVDLSSADITETSELSRPPGRRNICFTLCLNELPRDNVRGGSRVSGVVTMPNADEGMEGL